MDPKRSALYKGSNRSLLPSHASFKSVQHGVTTAERQALGLGASDEGTVVYDTDRNLLLLWNGTGWTDAVGGSVASALAPTFTSVTPSTGTTAGGTSVTIVGTKLTGTTSVTFGGTAATSVVVVDDTHVTCVTPAKTSGAKDIVITAEGSVTATGAYTYA